MKRVIVASSKRDKEKHIQQISSINADLKKSIQFLELQRNEAHNGDSSGKLLGIINSLRKSQKDLSDYLNSCRNAVNWW